MAEKPIPSTEAVDLLARAQYDYVRALGGGARLSDGTSLAWDDLPNSAKPRQQQMSLDLLLVAYPQIVADVLNHYADTAEARTDRAKHWTGDVSQWLRAEAAEVLS